jgi:hypothetical protein
METTIARVNSKLTHKRLVLALAAFLLALLLSLTAAAAPADDAVTDVQADNPNPPASTVKLIFIHHSCGSNWLRNNNGGLGIALSDSNYFVSDTNYGWGPDTIGDNTDIGHWWTWLRAPRSGSYLAALYAESDQHSSYSRLPTDPSGENEIIMFKSCYPNSNLRGDPAENPPPIGSNPLRGQSCGSPHHTVANAKSIYNDLLEYFGSRQDKLFVVITAPPVQNATHASNARAFNTWLVEEWLNAYPHNNVAVFDFYNVLTSNGGNWHTNDLGWATGNHHRRHNEAIEYMTDQGTNTAAYPNDGSNNHPSSAGNQKASSEFLPLLNIFYHRWKGAGETPTPTATGAPPTATPTHTPTLPDSPTPTPSATLRASATPTRTPSTGQQTMIFQDGVSPDGSYAGTTDVILANDEDNVAPNANLGGLDHLETFFGEGEEHRHCLMRWDLSALPGDATISSATVELYRYEGDAESDMQITLYRLTRDWDEGTGWDFWPDPGYVPDGATWALASPGTPWTTPGGDFDTTIVDQITLPATLASGWIPLDATTAVRAWIEQGVPNYGLLLRPMSGEYTYHYYYSRNYPTANLRQRLLLTYTVGTAATPTPTGTGEPSPTPTLTETPTPAYRIYLPLIMKGGSAPALTPTPTNTPISAQLIQPTDLMYQGAFRLPDGPEEMGWEWSGAAMTYTPDGDPHGPADGFPCSIFGTGHNWNQYVSEISIPIPVVSADTNVNGLNTAATLQESHNIRGNLFPEFEIPHADLEYLQAQGEQTRGKLYSCWAQHMGEGETNPCHGWSGLDLSNPQTAGAWRIGDCWNYVTTDYIFAIPQDWADANTPRMYLATGRFRHGGQGGQGPPLFAYGPWNEGHPLAPGSTLPTVPLLLYGNAYTPGSPTMDNYHHSYEWSGGAWLSPGSKSAVIFVGTKGTGKCWYGCPDGTVWPDEPPYPPACPDRGWWSTGFEGQIIFYDPADLAAVARGAMETWEPQPYATLNIDEYLYHLESGPEKHHLGAASFDRERGLLYVFEPLADGDKSLIHACRIG